MRNKYHAVDGCSGKLRLRTADAQQPRLTTVPKAHFLQLLLASSIIDTLVMLVAEDQGGQMSPIHAPGVYPHRPSLDIETAARSVSVYHGGGVAKKIKLGGG